MENKDHKIETENEQKWFNVLKEKAEDIDWGDIKIEAKIKGGQITYLKVIEKGESYNIGT